MHKNIFLFFLMIIFCCVQKGEDYYRPFWDAINNKDLQKAILLIDSLKNINPSFQHNDTSLDFMVQTVNEMAKIIEDENAIKAAIIDSLAQISAEREDSIREEFSKKICMPIISELEKNAQVFCAACEELNFETEDLSGNYLCCGAAVSLDISADSTCITVLYQTPIFLDDDKLKFILFAMSKIILELEPSNQMSTQQLKNLLTKSYSSGHSEMKRGFIEISLDVEETFSTVLGGNLNILNCKIEKKHI